MDSGHGHLAFKSIGRQYSTAEAYGALGLGDEDLLHVDQEAKTGNIKRGRS